MAKCHHGLMFKLLFLSKNHSCSYASYVSMIYCCQLPTDAKLFTDDKSIFVCSQQYKCICNHSGQWKMILYSDCRKQVQELIFLAKFQKMSGPPKHFNHNFVKRVSMQERTGKNLHIKLSFLKHLGNILKR